MFLTPDIRLDGEGIVCEALWCGPLDGKLSSSMGSVRVTSHQPAEAKVCNFHNMIFTNQAVPCSKIPEREQDRVNSEKRRVKNRNLVTLVDMKNTLLPVYKVLFLKVFHGRGNLCGHV